MPLEHTLSFLFLETFSRELKKLSLLFQFSKIFFPKMEINGHTLVKSNKKIKKKNLEPVTFQKKKKLNLGTSKKKPQNLSP